MAISYKDSGVDKESGYKEVELIKKIVKNTYTKGVLSDLGGFSGLFQIDKDAYKEPVLVSGTDGVGTKLKIAFDLDKHDTIGQDCVAMCVNDILCQGAKPLFFLDYIATGKLFPEKMAEIVKGVADACIESGCALVGGETAEMPGLYSEDEYDMAGFCVGIVDKEKIINGKKTIKKGDVVLGFPSSGIHSNGYSLVRKIIFDHKNFKLDTYIDELGTTLGEELIKPTKLYVKPVLELLKKFNLKGISHITGGGFFENIPRVLADDLAVKIDISKIETPKIFELLQKWGEIPLEEMYGTFNMGIGMIIVVSPEDKDAILTFMKENKDNSEKLIEIGKIIEKNDDIGVVICQTQN